MPERSKSIYEVLIGDSAFLAEVSRDGRYHIRAVWDDTQAKAWGNEDFGWTYLIPNEQANFDENMLAKIFKRREPTLGAAIESGVSFTLEDRVWT